MSPLASNLHVFFHIDVKYTATNEYKIIYCNFFLMSEAPFFSSSSLFIQHSRPQYKSIPNPHLSSQLVSEWIYMQHQVEWWSERVNAWIKWTLGKRKQMLLLSVYFFMFSSFFAFGSFLDIHAPVAVAAAVVTVNPHTNCKQTDFGLLSEWRNEWICGVSFVH